MARKTVLIFRQEWIQEYSFETEILIHRIEAENDFVHKAFEAQLAIDQRDYDAGVSKLVERPTSFAAYEILEVVAGWPTFTRAVP